MTSTLFAAAHAAAKAVHKPGDDYKATFGQAYRRLLAVAAPKPVEDIAKALSTAFDAGGEKRVAAFLRRLDDPAAVDRIALALHREAFRHLLSDTDRFARMAIQSATVASLGSAPGPTTIAFGS